MDKIVFTLLQKLEIKHIPKEELSFQIKSHPSYPSLHAITGVLSHFNIDNLALDVPVNEETLAQLPKSFIAQIKTDHGEDFAVVTNDGLYYEVIFSDKKKTSYPIDEFLEKFTGIMVAIEKDENIVASKTNKSLLGTSLWLLTILLLVSVWIVSKPDLLISLFLFVSFIGVYVSVSIVKQEQGLQTTLGEAFCSGESEKRDCDAVINSTGALLFGVFKLSDLSLIYFVGLSLLTYIILVGNIAVTLPYAFGLVAVLITLYSIYYQAFVVKKWCGLCLSIVGVLWLQAIIVSLDFSSLSMANLSLNEILIAAFSFLFVTTVWLFLKPNIEALKELNEEKIKYYKFKRNFNLFHTLLKKSEPINTDILNADEIVFGKNENSLSITIITNPFCGHCKGVHTLVEEINKKYLETTNITVRFNVNAENYNSDTVRITSRLIELYHKEGPDASLKAMHAIYGGQEPNSWLEEWGKCYDPATYSKVLEKESAWCNENNINFTPEILINGRSFPKEYDRSDLVYFIEELHEEYIETLEMNTPAQKIIE